MLAATGTKISSAGAEVSRATRKYLVFYGLSHWADKSLSPALVSETVCSCFVELKTLCVAYIEQSLHYRIERSVFHDSRLRCIFAKIWPQ